MGSKIDIKPEIVQVPKLSSQGNIEAFFQKEFNESGTVVFYLDYKVLIGKFDGIQLKFIQDEKIDPIYIQKCRLFNKDKELYIWRRDIGQLHCRIRHDASDINNEYIMDTNSFLLGKIESVDGEFAVLKEDRGSKFAIPADGRIKEKDEFQIKVRYYLDYNSETFQAGFIDMRFVEIGLVGK